MTDAVSLAPLEPEPFAAWLAATTVDYADDLRGAGLSEAAAQHKARSEMAKDFPDGVATDGQFVFAVVAEGESVGVLWIAPGPADDPTNWWVFDLTIAAAHRGRGFGREAMLLGEREASARGARKLSLNVFARNHAAAHLYDSLGYQPTKIYLQKDLPTPAEP